MSTKRPGNWPSFLRLTTPLACLVFGAATNGFAQHVEFGFKTGVPLTNVLQNTAVSSPGGTPFQARTKGYTAGPVVDITLPGPLSIEVGTMYKRIEQQAPQVNIIGYTCLSCEESQAILKVQSISTPARSWEFPVTVQYHFSLHSMQPYVEGGLSYNHLSDVLGSSFPYGLGFPMTAFVPTVFSINRTGFLVGGGVKINLSPIIHLTPGLRYTRYDKVEYFLPSPNAVDFIVGFHFLKF